jgi:hypothetical protein
MALVNLAQASARGFLQHADERRARPSLVLAQIRALTFGTTARPLSVSSALSPGGNEPIINGSLPNDIFGETHCLATI